jgi:UDP-N-acetylmuramyl pentapeptide phosphotransferase/UDP-N-acetylglucosamine-1-phosphate transferase
MLISYYLYIGIAFLSSIVLAYIVIPQILFIAAHHALYDIPNKRKRHKGNIPRIGGVSFVPCILISVMLSFGLFFMNGHNISTVVPPNIKEFCFFFSAILLIYLAGVKDDLVGMRYKYKFCFQVYASILIISSGVYINNLHGLFGIYELTPWIGVPLTILAMVFVVNAMNLIDGMDGLASGISIIALCIYGFMYQLQGLWFYTLLAFSTVGVLIPFFYYNVFGDADKGKKIFMGDSGSLSLGFILGFLLIRYWNYSPELILPTGNTVIVAISPVMLPMLDVLRVMIIRIKNGKSIFKADRNHIHHKLTDIGLNNSISLAIILLTSIMFCIINLITSNFLRTEFILILDISLWFMLNLYFNSLIRQRPKEIKSYVEMRTGGVE